MHEIIVGKEGKIYRVYVENTMDRFKIALKDYKISGESKVFVVTDDLIYNTYKNNIEWLKIKIPFKIFYFKNGEQSKNINTVKKVYDFLIENKVDRESILIALGGGVVGDLVGFVASTYMRGIRYINVPTTLLSQVDSCIGGKVAFNYGGIKNIIGSFYDPEFVYISLNFLKTLDRKEILNGLGEIIKYGLISDGKLLSFLNENAVPILNLEHDKLLHIVIECLKIKNRIVVQDVQDLSIRNVLNFGHTIAHGIEVDSKYKIPHGVAVALGILVAIKISEIKLGLDKTLYNKLENLYRKFGLPTRYKVDNYKSFMYAINRDKKNINENINMVLLENIGKYKIKVNVKSEEILEALKLSIIKEE
ncbi:3-dehydroquinate synthase [Haloimpatiens lingqiaonensis]|uniref:3-dehydroquinate synthase n=1 Tax=Haloimpatiens lingqiaonensis TaxID=1380675 RepID=UPI0010FF16D6|nr:3-dehydroquinate synthase [Haloimpatiens lingqiaonensis]